MQVIKRDGRVVEFDQFRIVNAIVKSMAQTADGVDMELANKIASSIEKQLESQTQINVYEIQDLVEKKLMGSSRKEVAQSYITYRYNRDVARKSKTKEVFLNIISEKSNDFSKENINMNSDTPVGMMMKFASEASKPLVDDFLLSNEVREAEKEGYIDIHNKDYYPTKSLNCMQHPLNRILENGFRARHSSSRPAERIEAASSLACISLQMIQNEMDGGQSIPAFDYFLAPYVKKTFIDEVKKIGQDLNIDITELLTYQPREYIEKSLEDLKGNDRIIQIAINRTENRVLQAMEAFIHNLNTTQSRGGNELVFSSINYGTDTSPEGRCIIREILKATNNGVGYGETAMFPVQIWKKKKGINYLPEDKNYDLYKFSLEVTSKRFFPNYINLDATFNKQENWNENDKNRWYYECATMGNGMRIFEDKNGETTSVGKGILSYTTINLPKIAIESALKAQEKLGMNFELGIGAEKHLTAKYKQTVKRVFFTELEKYTSLVSVQLYQRFKFQATAIKKQFPLLMSGMWQGSENLNSNDMIENVIKHGVLAISFIGLAECLVALTGKHHGESDEAQNLGIEIITQMKDLAEEFSEKYNLNYAIMASPEEVSSKFAKLDKNKYGSIKGVTNRNYYTTSNHVPIWYECTVEHKIKIEAPYHNLCKAGHTCYIELNQNDINDFNKIERLVDFMDEYNIGYLGINHIKLKCLNCGFESDDTRLIRCQKCGSLDIDTIQRVTGYILKATSFSDTKKLDEIKDRVFHT